MANKLILTCHHAASSPNMLTCGAFWVWCCMDLSSFCSVDSSWSSQLHELGIWLTAWRQGIQIHELRLVGILRIAELHLQTLPKLHSKLLLKYSAGFDRTRLQIAHDHTVYMIIFPNSKNYTSIDRAIRSRPSPPQARQAQRKTPQLNCLGNYFTVGKSIKDTEQIIRLWSLPHWATRRIGACTHDCCTTTLHRTKKYNVSIKIFQLRTTFAKNMVPLGSGRFATTPQPLQICPRPLRWLGPQCYWYQHVHDH